jgi:hypothetical protein
MSMNTKTGVWALGLLALSGVALINCGGSSDSSNDNPKAGSSSTAGTAGSGTAGTPTAGNASGGTGSGTAGMTSNAGSDPGTNGGDDGGPDFPGFGGDGNFPGAGGDGNFGLGDCPEGTATGEECTPADGGPQAGACSLGGSFCTCIEQGDAGTWFCLGDNGEGGAGPGGGTVTCPASAMTGDTCTGRGPCPGQDGCRCLFNAAVVCQ